MSSDDAVMALRGLKIAKANLINAREDLDKEDNPTTRGRFLTAHGALSNEINARRLASGASDPTVAQVIAESVDLQNKNAEFFGSLPEDKSFAFPPSRAGPPGGASPPEDGPNDGGSPHETKSPATEKPQQDGGQEAKVTVEGIYANMSEANKARLKLEVERVCELAENSLVKYDATTMSGGEALRKELMRATNLVYDNKIRKMIGEAGGDSGCFIPIGSRTVHVWDYLREFDTHYMKTSRGFDPQFIPIYRPVLSQMDRGDKEVRGRPNAAADGAPTDASGARGEKKPDDVRAKQTKRADSKKRQDKSGLGDLLDSLEGTSNTEMREKREFLKDLMKEVLKEVKFESQVKEQPTPTQPTGNLNPTVGDFTPGANVPEYIRENVAREEANMNHQFGPPQWDQFQTCYPQGQWGPPYQFQPCYNQYVAPPASVKGGNNNHAANLNAANNNNATNQNVVNNNNNNVKVQNDSSRRQTAQPPADDNAGSGDQRRRTNLRNTTIFNCATLADYEALRSVSEAGSRVGAADDAVSMADNGQTFQAAIAEAVRLSTAELTRDQRDSNCLTRLQSFRPPKPFNKGKEGIDFEVHLARYQAAMNQCRASDQLRLSEMQHWWTGASYDTIERYIFTDHPEQAVRDALKDLEARFGQKSETAEEILRVLMEKKPIDKHDHEGILDFIAKLENTYQLASLTGKKKEFDRKVVLATIIKARLPMWKESWNSKYVKNELAGKPSLVFTDLIKFLNLKQREAVENDSPTFQGFGASDKSSDTQRTTRQSTRQKFWKDKKGRERQSNTASLETTPSAAAASKDEVQKEGGGKEKGKGNPKKKEGSKGPCGYCKGKTHTIISCMKFQQLSLEDRRSKGMELGACFRCGAVGQHKSNGCPEKGSIPPCTQCGKGHNALFCDPQLAAAASSQK